jgi:hypothetical protein
MRLWQVWRIQSRMGRAEMQVSRIATAYSRAQHEHCRPGEQQHAAADALLHNQMTSCLSC